VRLLVDTNVFLELLLEQARSAEARQVLEQIEANEFFVSELRTSFYWDAAVPPQTAEVFRRFLADVNTSLTMVSLTAKELDRVIDASTAFNLGFDDAYQYTVASKYNLTIVSFDADFDRTDLGRKQPAALL